MPLDEAVDKVTHLYNGRMRAQITKPVLILVVILTAIALNLFFERLAPGPSTRECVIRGAAIGLAFVAFGSTWKKAR